MNSSRRLSNCTSACLRSICTLDTANCSISSMDNSSCSAGCRLFTELEELEGSPPSPPESPPWLFLPNSSMDEAGRYNLFPDPSDMPTGPAGGSVTLTSFLVKVLVIAKGKSFDLWLPSFEEVLNLGQVACERVLVSFAPINKFTAASSFEQNSHTPFSPATNVEEVYGVSASHTPPENPDTSTISLVQAPDTRFGYWKHATVTLSWTEPMGSRSLSHYAVRLFTANGNETSNCGSVDISINTTRTEHTNVTIMAEVPTDGPFTGCSYLVTVTSVPLFSDPEPALEIPLTVEVSNPTPLNFKCGRSWDDLRGAFHFTTRWEVPNSPTLLDAISSFEVEVRLIKPHLPHEKPETLTSSNTTFDRNSLSYNLSSNPVRSSSDAESYFSIQLTTNAASPLAQRLVPDPVHCEYSSAALPPPTPQGVHVDEEQLEYTAYNQDTCELELQASVSWQPPQRHRRVGGYEIRLAESSDDNPGEVFARKRTEESEVMQVLLVAEIPADMPATSCLYLQVRSVSSFMSFSNWSTPLCILPLDISVPHHFSPFASQCNLNTTTDTDTTTTVEAQNKSVVVYFVVGLGCGMMVLTSIVLMVMALSCLHRKQQMVSKLESQPSLRKHLSQFTPFTQQLCDPLSMGTNSPSSLPPSPTKSPPPPPPEDWELHPSLVLVETRMGHGTFGDVFKGMVRGGVGLYQSRSPLYMNNVAIKLLKTNSTVEEREAFLGHIEQAKAVAKELRSQYFVQLVGCVTMYDPLCLATELPVNGDLLTYLDTCRKSIFATQDGNSSPNAMEVKVLNSSPQHHHHGNGLEPAIVVVDSQPRKATAPLDEDVATPAAASAARDFQLDCITSSRELLGYAYQIASGMEKLSALGVVHGDVACRNVYLDHRMNVKIADFSLNTGNKPRGGSRIYLHTEAGRLPIKWMAMESLAESHFSIASDVWAFGITLWEIVTLGGLPYNGMRNKDVLNHLQRGYRLKKPGNCSQEIYHQMISCWDGDPRNRPSFKALKEAISEINMQEDATPTTTTPISLELDRQSSCYRILSSCRKRRREQVKVATPAGSGEQQQRLRQEATPTTAASSCCEQVEVEVAAAEEREEEEEEEEVVSTMGNSATGKLAAYSYLSIIEEDEEEVEEERGNGGREEVRGRRFEGEEESLTEVIANEHTMSLTSSSPESSTSGSITPSGQNTPRSEALSGEEEADADRRGVEEEEEEEQEQEDGRGKAGGRWQRREGEVAERRERNSGERRKGRE